MNSTPQAQLELIADLSGQFRRRPRLLVVDDEPVNVQVLYQVFSADHQVLMATSGEQALSLSIGMQPDLVLLDVVMPGMHGYQVCERLKAEPATANIPVIFVTAHDHEAAEARGLDVGAVDFISKPISPRIVRARVKTHLTLKAQSDLLRDWVYIDGLTGAHNRRAFDERLAREWSRAARAGTTLSVVLLDVDFFKRYNDRYGHQAGDECLVRIAASLKAGLKRPGDFVARYGGEEFVCLLPDTDLGGAMQLASRLGQQVAEQQIGHADSAVAPVITISLGVASTHTQPPGAGARGSAADLLRQADAQLYLAKAQGRNCVCGAELDSP